MMRCICWHDCSAAGQFGTRLQGGKDAAGARYIMTRLAPMARTLFHEHDDALLAYLREEGQRIEPSGAPPFTYPGSIAARRGSSISTTMRCWPTCARKASPFCPPSAPPYEFPETSYSVRRASLKSARMERLPGSWSSLCPRPSLSHAVGALWPACGQSHSLSMPVVVPL